MLMVLSQEKKPKNHTSRVSTNSDAQADNNAEKNCCAEKQNRTQQLIWGQTKKESGDTTAYMRKST